MKRIEPESIISKEELKQLYLVQRINREKLAVRLKVSIGTINKVINYYGIIKENKLKNLDYMLNNINKENFINYYNNHNIWNTAEYYNTSPSVISQYCKTIGYTKDITGETKKEISKEELYSYYIEKDHTIPETATYFNMTTYMITKLKNEYGIQKDRSLMYSRILKKRWELAGSKEEYYNDIMKKSNQTHVENYGSLEKYQEIRSKAISDTWNSKTPEEKQAAITLTLAHGGGWNHKTALKTLKERYGVNNSYALATFRKGGSKLNEEFELKLIEANSYESKEFVLKKPEGSYYRYDFKFKNILIELNPSITHNSTFNIFGDSPLDPLYHYNKTKLALENGYKCLCLWDWVDPKDLIALLQSDFGQTQTSPRRHLFNINTKSHIISQDEPFTPGEGWVEIWDDGSEINTNNS